jgi:hypothetical protein
VGDVEAVSMSVVARTGRVRSRLAMSCTGEPEAADVDGDDDYRAMEGQWPCPGGSW